MAVVRISCDRRHHPYTALYAMCWIFRHYRAIYCIIFHSIWPWLHQSKQSVPFNVNFLLKKQKTNKKYRNWRNKHIKQSEKHTNVSHCSTKPGSNLAFEVRSNITSSYWESGEKSESAIHAVFEKPETYPHPWERLKKPFQNVSVNAECTECVWEVCRPF